MDAHRQIPPSSLKIISAAQSFSCFDFVDTEFSSLNSASRCFSLARSHGLQSITIEDLPPAGIIEDENNEIALSIPDHRMTALKRLAFWTLPLEAENDIKVVDEKYLIGYAILKKDMTPSRNYDHWHVFEAVFRKYPHEHNCTPRQHKYTIRVGPVLLSIPGILYCQQNTLNKACAHVALRSLLSRRLMEGDIAYSTINRFAKEIRGGDDFDPGKGLSVPQMRDVLNRLNIPFRDIDYGASEKTNPHIRKQLPFQKFLYAGVESGAGALLGFRYTGPGVYDDRRHIIPFFGHTFNKDTWVPDADIAYFRVGEKVGYIPSESWTSSFLGHDDNFGANFCVPRLYVHSDQAEYVLELLHDHFRYGGAHAEALSLSFLYSLYPQLTHSANSWMNRLALHVDIQRVVLRAVATKTRDYLAHLDNSSDWHNHKESSDIIRTLKRMLPDILWVVEVSLPQLFPANERKVAEIVLNPETPSNPQKPVDFELFLFARLPGKYLIFSSEVDGKPEFIEIPSNLKSHMPVLRC